MFVRAIVSVILFLAAHSISWAQSVGDPFTVSDAGSCPAFHCDAEGTSLMSLAVPSPGSNETVGVLWQQSDALGSGAYHPGVQSCSSDGGDFTCLYTNGATSGVSALSVDAATLSGTFTLDNSALAASGTNAAVALYGTDKSIIVADGNSQKRIVADSSQSSGYRVVWQNSSPYANTGLTVSALTPLQYTSGSQTRTVIVVTYTSGKMIAFDPAYGYNTTSAGMSSFLT